MAVDIVIVGAGPAGLSLALSLAHHGLRITLVEPQSEAALTAPSDDGREIAITHHSRLLLERLGIWAGLAAEEIGLLRDAKVIDGADEQGLMFRHTDAGEDELGWLVSNYALRREAYVCAARTTDLTLLTECKVTAVSTTPAGTEVQLSTGEVLHPQLVVAADSRFSETRRTMGIPAHMHDFGKTVLLVRVQHERSHEHTAWEWFGHGQTVALLPLHDENVASIVLTVKPTAMNRLLALDDRALGEALTHRFDDRLGRMQVVGPRRTFPLVGVYAHRFSAERFALVGDAAVGMHPMTAHGFNFGLLGQDTLARHLLLAAERGAPFPSQAELRRFDFEHRLATWPLYAATQFIATLYTDDRPPARLARKLALHAAARLGPFKRLVVSGLTTERAGVPFPLRRAPLPTGE